MHNSLFLRDLLKKTNSDPMRLERRDPHRCVARDPQAAASSDEFELNGVWHVTCDALFDAPADVASLVVADVCDFLARMGVAVEPATHAEGSMTLSLRVVPDLAGRDCRLTCRPGSISVEGGDIAGLWAGIAWLEWEMRTRRGPFLPEGAITHRAAWPVQISQGPWGGNYSVPDFAPEYLSDDAFRLYAHYGVNSMMIYGDLLCYAQGDILPELNVPDFAHNLAMLKDAARRASRYGVQFSYVVVGPKLRPDHPVFVNHPNARGTGVEVNGQVFHFLCSGDEQVRAFYTETFERLFREAPELAGLVLIVAEESFYHCHMWRRHALYPCPRCSTQGTEQGISDLLAVINRAVKRAQPKAWVAAWPYTTLDWERPDRVEFIRQLLQDVAFWHALEKDQWLAKNGYRKHIWDYSVDFTGPSDNMRLTSAAAHETGHPLFVKTETGIGLEVFQFPYVPAMYRLADKWQNVRDLKPHGVQQSWLFFGMFGSRAEELALWAAYRPDLSRDDFLRHMVVRDFGPAAADAALSAWASVSRAAGHIPCVTLSTYYIGPSFLGPAHPLVPDASATIPDIFCANLFYLQELEETFSQKQLSVTRTSLVLDRLPERADVLGITWDGPSDGWDVVIQEYTTAASEAETGCQYLRQAEPLAQTEMDRRNLSEETLLAELFYRTIRSCENVLRFLRARRDLEGSGDPQARATMRQIALAERQNALDAIPIYRAAPWLDLAERTDGHFSRCIDMIEAKVQWIDDFTS